MITAERAKTIKNASSLTQEKRFKGARPRSAGPEGLVYKGEYASLWFSGGKWGCYYIAASAAWPNDYLLSSKTSVSLTLENGLAICKALDFYEKEEVKLLFYPEKNSGFITAYFSKAISLTKRYVNCEKELIKFYINYNEKILQQQKGMDRAQGFSFL